MKKFLLLSLSALFCTGLFAAPWAAIGPKRVPETLVIVSNYKSPRLMAELIQYESRAPFILLPAAGGKDQRIFFCPAKKNSVVIQEAKLNAFVRFLNPKRVVVIGNENVVSKRYTDLLDRTIPVVRIDSVDWDSIARELTFMLNLSNLGKDFRRLRENMLNDGKIYRPVSLPETQDKNAGSKLPDAEDPVKETTPAAGKPADAL